MALNRRAALRDRTAQSHAAVDTAIGPFVSLEAYRSYLQGVEAFRTPYESALADVTWPTSFGGWRPTLIAVPLAQDLRDLAVAKPPSPALARMSHDIAALLGTLYVLEGSALGARLLYNRALALGLRDDFGARHLSRQSRDVTSWRAFLAVLEEAEPIELDAMVTAANATFLAAENAFRGRVNGAL